MDREEILLDNATDGEQGHALPQIVFKVKDSKFAISSKYVVHIQVLETITPMVGTNSDCRGVVLYHDVSVPVYDMKKIFHLEDNLEELDTMMQHRIQDHKNWVEELERSVAEDREFTLTTDPHQCKFGKWLDTFETDNSYLRMYLNGVHEPHRAVHETGISVNKLIHEGKKAEAQKLIEKMKESHYKKTVGILAGAAQAIKDSMREMLIVLQVENELKGILVDSITDIKVLDDLCGLPPNMETSAYIEGIARDVKPNHEIELIQLINVFEL